MGAADHFLLTWPSSPYVACRRSIVPPPDAADRQSAGAAWHGHGSCRRLAFRPIDATAHVLGPSSLPHRRLSGTPCSSSARRVARVSLIFRRGADVPDGRVPSPRWRWPSGLVLGGAGRGGNPRRSQAGRDRAVRPIRRTRSASTPCRGGRRPRRAAELIGSAVLSRIARRRGASSPATGRRAATRAATDCAGFVGGGRSLVGDRHARGLDRGRRRQLDCCSRSPAMHPHPGRRRHRRHALPVCTRSTG